MKNTITFLFVFAVLFLGTAHASKNKTTQDQNETPAILPAVHFDTAQTTIKEPEMIARNAEWLKSHSEKVVVLEGHCDERGGLDYNLELGDRRARAVMAALMEKGVPEKQIIIMSYGKNRPLVPHHSENGWEQNRRVEFMLR